MIPYKAAINDLVKVNNQHEQAGYGNTKWFHKNGL